ncbi:MAG TPA: methionine synthase [Alphaproteobacteria bacterium]
MTTLAEYLADQVLLLDAGTGGQVQAMDLDVDADFDGNENCTEVLNRTRPDLVRGLHEASLEAGSDAVQANSFGGSPITLGEFALAGEAFDLNRRAAVLAREAVERFAGDGRARFVFGSVGPGTRLASLAQVDYDTLEDALAVQCSGLVAGGVDAILIETVQDLLQAKAAVNGARRAFAEAGRELPIAVQVTIETTGTLLVGADIAAAATVLEALRVPIMGLNCATGPQEMAEHVHWLAEHWPGQISVQPNAGLPELVDGRTRYPLGPEVLAHWLARFVDEDGVGLIGGCCGTTPAHIAALDAMLRARAGAKRRPAPARRRVHWLPAVSSLYGQVPLRQENAILMIGERCNANGSKLFRAAQVAEDWDACLAIARDQVAEGSHCLDLCAALVERDEVADMERLVPRLAHAVPAPLVLDSTELKVLARAFRLYGGKPILNSINFEDGEAPAAARLELARRFGAAVIALTIDETGMAKGADAKLQIAERLADFACGRFGLAPADLLIDPLTFTICTGNDDDRRLGVETLEAIERIARALPESQIVLGLSNISFGLKPAARHVLNSVFLHHARARGMTAAIIHVGKIVALHQIPDHEVAAAEDLIFDRRRPGHDPLHAFIALYEGREASAARARPRPATVEERLKQRIVDGDRTGLEADLDLALDSYAPLEIINTHLLDGMKVVGELFGSGRMQLPFVLQSAETMKAAVAHLEPHMERIEGQAKGTIVLATVKGDVHDIGKNLTDIILTNNGYRVVNLGIKQPLANILDAARAERADCVGMSGLLVKSAAIMRENLAEMTRLGLDIPVLLGGAALTRRFVEGDCRTAYAGGPVAYARDAFDGLKLMEAVVAGRFDEVLGASVPARPAAEAEPAAEPVNGAVSPLLARVAGPDRQAIRLRRAEYAREAAVPTPPFWGARLIERVPVSGIRPYLNTHTLYQLHWGYKKQGRSFRDFQAWARKELTPILDELIGRCEAEDILVPSAAYGYWRAVADGDDVVLLDEAGARELARFALPRQGRADGLCIADFLRDADSGESDVIGLQVVTVGARASEVERAWFHADRYRDYLYLHGLGVEIAEAMAEYVHARIRGELGFGHEDAREIAKLLKQGYRGARYSFGYPACPNLEDQAQLLELLGAGRIGVVLGEEAQLHPEQSTSAIVLHHPRACYFAV